MPCSRLTLAAAVAALLLMPQAPGWSQDRPAQNPSTQERGAEEGGAAGRPTRERAAAALPADKTSRHSLALASGSLPFVATAGSIQLRDDEGNATGEIAYIAYRHEGGDRNRPVTFAFNGGPGSASAWLHLGTLGPWRLVMNGDAVRPSANPELLANAESWLPFTDLVFVDPIGTGFSRPIANAARQGQSGANSGGRGGAERSPFYGVEGDITSLAQFIRRWLTANGRLASPKIVIGESYGGFRGPRLATALAGSGVGLDALILVSPVLDFGSLGGGRHHVMTHVARLPSLIASARQARNGALEPNALDRLLVEAEAYARGDYLDDLLKGPNDEAAVARIAGRIATLSGLNEGAVRQAGGRLDTALVLREALRSDGRVASPYDGAFTGLDRDPTVTTSFPGDPFTGALAAPVTSAMLRLYGEQLGWLPDRPYRLLNGSVNGAWDWGRGRNAPESFGALRNAMALDPALKVLVAHGATDLVTPYLDTKLLIEQLPVRGAPRRVRLKVYRGGHMFYSDDGSRASFRDDGQRLLSELARRNAP